MATGFIDFWMGAYHREIKRIFGNQKNYRRWIELKKLEQWNNWLFSLGYRLD